MEKWLEKSGWRRVDGKVNEDGKSGLTVNVLTTSAISRALHWLEAALECQWCAHTDTIDREINGD